MIAGIQFYYFIKINAQNSKIALLNLQEQNLNIEATNLSSQISNLTSQITNLSTANLTTSLTMTDKLNLGSSQLHVPPYNYFVIEGSVDNTGVGTAYNAGLYVVAYAGDGTIEINMTIPLLDGGTFATDNQIANNPLVHVTPLAILKSENLYQNLYANQTTTIDIVSYHESMVFNWTVTPVWTNTP